MVGERRIEWGRFLSVASMASNPSKVRGWLYTLTSNSWMPYMITTQEDTSLELLVMGWMFAFNFELT